MDTAVVLVSGGVNSCVLAGIASKEYRLALMHVNYGQRTADREQACFSALCQHFQAADKLLVLLPHVQTVGANARVDRKQVVEDASGITERPTNTYVPGLLPAILGLAYHWADAIGARRILVGSSENNGPPGPRTSLFYPDHRRELYHLYYQVIEVTARSPSKIALEVPLISMTRGEVVRLGQHLGVPFGSTWSCDRNTDKPCGTCYGCASRARGFLDAAVPDPMMIKA